MGEIKDLGNVNGPMDLSGYDLAIAPCRPMNPDDYAELGMTSAWEVVASDITTRTGATDFRPYPDSEPGNCEVCKILVGVGPRTRASIATAKAGTVKVLCLVCAAVSAGTITNSGMDIDLAHLGNGDR